MHLRLCIMCGDEYRKPRELYCNSCMVYKGYEKEQWYKELLSMQQQQRRINKRECFTLLIDHPAGITGKPIIERQVAMVRSVGRPKKFTDTHVALVRKLYNEAGGNISVRKLTRAVELAGITMSRETIRSYMQRFKLETSADD